MTNVYNRFGVEPTQDLLSQYVCKCYLQVVSVGKEQMQDNLEGSINCSVYASLETHAGRKDFVRCVVVGRHDTGRWGERGGVAFRDKCSFLCKWTAKAKLSLIFQIVLHNSSEQTFFRIFLLAQLTCTFLYKG